MTTRAKVIRTPSPRQLEVLRAISDLFHEKGYAPSQQELGSRLGITPEAARKNIHRLIEHKWLTQGEGRYRNYSLSRAAKESLRRIARTVNSAKKAAKKAIS